MAIRSGTKDKGVSVQFSPSELIKFRNDTRAFVSEFGEKKLEAILRSAVRRIPLQEAKAILAAKAQSGTGDLKDLGLIVAKERGVRETASILIGGGRQKKHNHGWIAHWVELGTSGIVRDGGTRYKSGQRYSKGYKGINFLRDSAENTSSKLFESINRSMERAFRKMGK